MPNTNLNSLHFSEEEKNKINSGLSMVWEVLQVHQRNLNAEERNKYGSVSEQNKLVVQKSLDFHDNHPRLDCPDVDYQELKLDWADRTFMAGTISRMAEYSLICNNIRITHDYDAYQTSLDDYDYTKYKMGRENGAGWETKYKEMLPFFKTNDTPPVPKDLETDEPETDGPEEDTPTA